VGWASRDYASILVRHSRGSRLSSTSAKDQNKAYAATLRLPKTDFPLWSEPSKREAPFQKRTTEDLYKWQVGGISLRDLRVLTRVEQHEHAKGSRFILHDGPPYANGNLHMGLS
jgi:isoleucyl-tRNA synthetase